MTARFEVALPLGALAFYVYDCACLVHDDEVMLHGWRRRWSATVGSSVVLFARRVCAPALFMPWRSVFQAFVNVPGAADAGAVSQAPVDPDALDALRVLSTLLLVLLAIALPVASLAFGTGLILLAVFASYYALVVIALILLYRRRHQLSLATRAFWVIALDVLACAPFAVNLVRRVTLRQPLTHDALAAAKACVTEGEYRRLASVIEARLAPR